MLIIGGDPAKGPATYTRFVLPFAYCLTSYITSDKAKSNNQSYYEEIEPEDLVWRKKYLTYETANVLFKRAKWLALKNSPYPLKVNVRFRDYGKDDYITVYIKPPALVLFEFEWPKPGRKCSISSKGAGSGRHIDDTHNMLRTGFLVLEVYFAENSSTHPNLDNLLELNELFRYWQQPFEGHEEKMGYKKLLSNLPFSYHSTETISQKNDPLDLYFERWAGLIDIPVKDKEGNLWRLFPREWMENARKFVSGEDKVSQGWAIYSDMRTFVWTCAIMENGGKKLATEFSKQNWKPCDFGHWIKLLNVDLPGENINKTHQSTDFERKLSEERTYKRWEEGGTFYGFNYHCGAMLGPPFKEPPLWKHFGQMYFDQILLLLYIRVSLFRFSMELNRISSDAIDKKKIGSSVWREEFQKLRWSFALFTDLYLFPLLSNQQQGIEMYSLARKHINVDDLFKEVKEKIEDCHEYLTAVEAIELSDIMGRLTVVATMGFVIIFVVSFMGMNVFEEPLFKNFSILMWIPLSLVFSIILLILFLMFSRQSLKCFDWLSKVPQSLSNFIKRKFRRSK